MFQCVCCRKLFKHMQLLMHQMLYWSKSKMPCCHTAGISLTFPKDIPLFGVLSLVLSPLIPPFSGCCSGKLPLNGERLTPRLKIFCFQKMAKKKTTYTLFWKKDKYAQTQLQHEEIWYFCFSVKTSECRLTAVRSSVWFGWDSWGCMETGGNISPSSLLPLV